MKGVVNELFFLRAVACLAVVIIHSINVTFENIGIREDPDFPLINNILFAVQILLMFGTPMFVFISEFIIAYSYQDKKPKGFMTKRIKFIFIPYISMGVFYSILRAFEQNINSVGEFITMVSKVIFLGDFHGYFVLIIFQFYILHFVFAKYIEKKFSARYIVGFAIVINFLYLGFFNFQSKPIYIEQFYWDFITKIPFLAWVAYFVIAFYCGRNFNRIKHMLNKYNKVVITAPILTGIVVLLMCYSGLLTAIHSKRVDVLFYTVSVAFFLLYIATKFKNIPSILYEISSYSFGIYLLHPFFQGILQKVTPNNHSFSSLLINIILYIMIGVLAPILCVYLLNKTTIGPFLVGKTGMKGRNNQNKIINKIITET